jgi:zinc D-Ala-D-Ala dipeptidase
MLNLCKKATSNFKIKNKTQSLIIKIMTYFGRNICLTNRLLYLILIFVFNGCKEKKATNQESKTIVVRPKIERESELARSLRSQGLVNVLNVDKSILVDLKYSTSDNFFKEDVYGSLNEAFLQVNPALALKTANDELKNINKNYRLLIYDGARPLSIQKILWDRLDSIPKRKRKDFVADPDVGSIHNYGCAVDLSVYDISTKKPLDMGTNYDFFGDLAFPRKEKLMLKLGKLSQKQIDNRLILRNAMIKSGYMPITSEWWHFNFYTRKKAEKLYKIIK